MYANHGALKKHQHAIEGINSRLDGLQAAILDAKLPYIFKWTEQRITNAAYYTQKLSGIAQIITPVIRENTKHTFHLYVIKAEKRNDLQLYLKERGVETAIHYPTPLPLLPAYSYLNKIAADFPEAVNDQAKILSLPMYPELTTEMIDYVVEKVKEFYA